MSRFGVFSNIQTSRKVSDVVDAISGEKLVYNIAGNLHWNILFL